ncbi:MAG: response regulator [Steroidobacteraceae bacterium]|nr:response regulator [Steroidobacteraceae bacterium]
MNIDGTVYVIDDDRAVADSTALLMQSLGLAVATFASAEEFLAAYQPTMKGCVLLDLRMGGMDGLALMERLRELESPLAVVFLTAYGDVPTALRALKDGATHFLMKPAREHDLLEAVNRALRAEQGQRPRARMRSLLRTRLQSLTARESQVLEQVLAGRATKAMATVLGISERTVEAHRARAFEKLRVRSVPELVRAFDLLG